MSIESRHVLLVCFRVLSYNYVLISSVCFTRRKGCHLELAAVCKEPEVGRLLMQNLIGLPLLEQEEGDKVEEELEAEEEAMMELLGRLENLYMRKL